MKGGFLLNKELGQVFTPLWVVRYMLDIIGYKGEQILVSNILEPSSGDGAFLIEIVKRYIEEGERKKWTNQEIIKGLEKHIFAIEIDENMLNLSITRLNALLIDHGIVGQVQWNIKNADSLTSIELHNQMDFVVGNPPYIRVHNILEETRNYIKSHYYTCKKGNMDVYIAFYEFGMNCLNETGRLVYISPNSFMKNTSNAVFREWVRENNWLETLVDFGNKKVFDAATYPAILLLNKVHGLSTVDYYKWEEELEHVAAIELSDFKGKAWNFSSQDDIQFVQEKTNNGVPLSVTATTQYGLATLSDKIFISSDVIFERGKAFFNGFEVETSLLQPIVKGSKYKGERIKSFILLPYRLIEDRWTLIMEEELQSVYPKSYAYFLHHKEALSNRNLEQSPPAWYMLGRSQGIKQCYQEKLLVKHIIHKDSIKIETYILPKEVFIYSGIFIVSTNIEQVQQVIEGADFLRYALISGKNMSGGYKSISTKVIKQFAT